MVKIEDIGTYKEWNRKFNVIWIIIMVLVLAIMGIFGYGIGMVFWYGFTIYFTFLIVKLNYKVVFPSFKEYENYDFAFRWFKDMMDLKFAFYLLLDTVIFMMVFFFGVYLDNPSYFSIYMFLSLTIPFSIAIILMVRGLMGIRKENKNDSEWKRARRWGIILGIMILIILPIIFYLIGNKVSGVKE